MSDWLGVTKGIGRSEESRHTARDGDPFGITMSNYMRQKLFELEERNRWKTYVHRLVEPDGTIIRMVWDYDQRCFKRWKKPRRRKP
jgi:hypothetical protein